MTAAQLVVPLNVTFRGVVPAGQIFFVPGHSITTLSMIAAFSDRLDFASGRCPFVGPDNPEGAEVIWTKVDWRKDVTLSWMLR
jgi:hypothetical protein